MRSEIMLYEYLYQVLLSQIYSGILRPGQKFPSQQELCRRYNVGITTARKVTRILEERGFIKTYARKRPIVVYEVDNQTYVSALLQRKYVILDILYGFRPIIAALHLEGAKRYESLEVLESIASNISGHMDEHALYDRTSRFLLELLRPYNNQIVFDLLTDSENFTNIPYLPISGLEDSYSITVEVVRSTLGEIVELMRRSDYDKLGKKLDWVYAYGRQRTERYLEALEARGQGDMTGACGQKPQEFMLKNRAYLYTVIARLIYRRILNGDFDSCKYLPSIPELMAEYSISQATAFSAVALLNDIGAVRTLDKKGTVIAEPGGDLPPIRMDAVSINNNLIFFLDALQILAVCSEALAQDILSATDKQTARSCAETWRRLELAGSGVAVRTLLTFFKEHSPYRCLSHVLEQMDYLLVWGHYLERDRNNTRTIDDRVRELFIPLCGALARRDIKAFSGYVRLIFHMAYETTRSLMVFYGMNEEALPVSLGDAPSLTDY